MAKIKASLADVSTEFKLLPPALYELEITKVDEIENAGELKAYRISSKVVGGGEPEQMDQTLSDYINLRLKNGELGEPGLATIKRYFEVTHGKEEVATWNDDDYDTDLLIGRRWRGQIVIDSYTKQGETEPRQNNKVARMDSVN